MSSRVAVLPISIKYIILLYYLVHTLYISKHFYNLLHTFFDLFHFWFVFSTPLYFSQHL